MKWYGKIGYALTEDNGDGIWTPKMSWKQYYGDVQRFSRRIESASQVNDNLNISNTISIIADPYALKNFGYMKCVEWAGNLWEISSIEISYPRMVLNIGGVYNGDTTGFTASV
jgi:hypothetical protein